MKRQHFKLDSQCELEHCSSSEAHLRTSLEISSCAFEWRGGILKTLNAPLFENRLQNPVDLIEVL